MASPRIRWNYEQLNQIARMFDGEAERSRGTLDDLKRCMEVLQSGDWAGEGAQAFYAEMNGTVLPAYGRLLQALNQAAQTTLKIRVLAMETEDTAARLLNRLPGQGTQVDMTAEGGGAAAAPQTGGGAQSSVGGDSGGGFWSGVGDFFGGLWDEGKDMVTGLGHMIAHPIDTAKGLWYGVTHPGALWDAFKAPYVDAWNSGHPWRAVGRGVLFVGSMLIGTHGADKAAKAAKAAEAARTAEVAEAAAKAAKLAEEARLAEEAAQAAKVAEQAKAAETAKLAEQAKAAEAAAQASNAGKLILPAGRTLSEEELLIANQLVKEGHTVEALAEGTTRTADFLVDGVRTELKTVSNITSKDVSGALGRRVLDGAGQAPNIIMDCRGQAGITRELAERAARRAYGADKGGRIQNIRFLGPDFDFTVPRVK